MPEFLSLERDSPFWRWDSPERRLRPSKEYIEAFEVMEGTSEKPLRRQKSRSPSRKHFEPTPTSASNAPLAEAQRDEALRTKAWIGTRREATAMATASAEKAREILAQEKEALSEQVGDSTNYKSVKSLHWLLDFFADSKGMWSAVGKKLKTISDEMGMRRPADRAQ